MKGEIRCGNCGTSIGFAHERELSLKGWYVLGIDIKNNLPICYCDKCEYSIKPRSQLTPLEAIKSPPGDKKPGKAAKNANKRPFIDLACGASEGMFMDIGTEVEILNNIKR